MDVALLKKIWPVFVEEAREHLQEISAGILEMERGTCSPGLLEGVRRTAHSMKGSAASLGLEDLEQLAHAVEDALAGHESAGQMEPGLVELLLGAIDACEAALAMGDAGGLPKVKNLEPLLESLAVWARAGWGQTPAPSTEQKSSGQAGIEQIWPVFSSEANEHLARLNEALASHEQRGGEDWSDPDGAGSLVHIAGSLKASASVLGLARMGQLATQAEAELGDAARTGKLSANKLNALRSTLQELGNAISRAGISGEEASAGGAQTAAAMPVHPGSLAAVFDKEAHDIVAHLEETLVRLRTPSAEVDRPQEIEDAARRAHNLKGSAAALGAKPIADAAAKIQEAVNKMGAPGRESIRATAAAAGLLVELKEALASWKAPRTGAPEPDAGAPAAPRLPPEGAQAAAGLPSRTIRASVSTLESLARQIEGLALGRAIQERRSRDLFAQAGSTQEIAVLCERALSELRVAGAGLAAKPLDEALQRLRLLQRGLLRLGQESSRETEQAKLVGTVVRDDLRDLRMVPASTALEPLRRTVREVVGRLKKQVELSIVGGDVRLDRRILDELKDPLVHLVRNAVDHGIESPDVRRTLGKKPAGSLEVRVERRGHRVAVIVADDGAGLSAEKIRAAAVRVGMLDPQSASQVPDADVLRLIFQAGLSTADQITSISGRGIGLDVVQAVATRLRGTIDVSSRVGQGTTFTLDLPLTLAATLAVVIKAGGEHAGLPYESVERILRLTAKDLGTVAGRASVLVDNVQVPFASLANVLGSAQGRLPFQGDRPQPCLLLEAAGQRVVLAIEQIIGQQEVVIHPLGRHLSRVPHLAGAAVLDDGRVVAILNAAELVRLARPLASDRAPESERPRVLVADDSLTTRSAMKAVLEIAGYQVVPASDGEEALRLLKEIACHLVVTDVQMPRMDGLTLTRRIKSDPGLAALPVIVVTSLDAPVDRAAGLEAGADGYLVKREVERGKLLELVRQLLPERI
jgi:two-component system chemotaxis sensor kinase CheA